MTPGQMTPGQIRRLNALVDNLRARKIPGSRIASAIRVAASKFLPQPDEVAVMRYLDDKDLP
jgi:hypothetical protein